MGPTLYPKNPDSSKMAILRTKDTTAIQVHSPFHWRIQARKMIHGDFAAGHFEGHFEEAVVKDYSRC